MGTKITRSTWQDNSFWTVTQIKTEMDGKRGKAYGLLTWRGEQQGEQPSRIRGASKKTMETTRGSSRSSRTGANTGMAIISSVCNGRSRSKTTRA
ncbi:hypothetical protein Ndes2526A_g04676 [Nannochloris sp. 'desiccata']